MKSNLKTFLADLYLDLAEDEKALDLLSGSDEETNASVLITRGRYVHRSRII